MPILECLEKRCGGLKQLMTSVNTGKKSELFPSGFDKEFLEIKQYRTCITTSPKSDHFLVVLRN
jgi:hypothetical protein